MVHLKWLLENGEELPSCDTDRNERVTIEKEDTSHQDKISHELECDDDDEPDWVKDHARKQQEMKRKRELEEWTQERKKVLAEQDLQLSWQKKATNRQQNDLIGDEDAFLVNVEDSEQPTNALERIEQLKKK